MFFLLLFSPEPTQPPPGGTDRGFTMKERRQTQTVTILTVAVEGEDGTIGFTNTLRVVKNPPQTHIDENICILSHRHELELHKHYRNQHKIFFFLGKLSM